MAYVKINLAVVIKSVGDDIVAADAAGEYKGNEAEWDGRILRELGSLFQTAVAQANAGDALIMRTNDSAKKAMAEAEALVKRRGKKIDVEDVALLEQTQDRIAGWKKTLDDDSLALIAANQDFRTFSPSDARKHLSDKNVLAPLFDVQSASVAASKRTSALKDRVDEYDSRIRSLVTIARKLAGAAAVDEQASVKAFTDDLKRARDLIAKLRPVERVFTEVIDLDSKGGVTAADLKLAQRRVVGAQATAKSARGALKTSEQLIANFKKVTAGTDGEARRERDALLRSAVANFKTDAAKFKKLDALEAKALKNLQVIAKVR